MKTIMNSIRAFRKSTRAAASRWGKAAAKACGQMARSWREEEAYWAQHPEARPHIYACRF